MSIDRKFRLARIWSNKELRKIAPLFKGNVLNVSAGENIDKEGKTYDLYFTDASSFSISNFNPGSFRGYSGKENEYLIDLEADLPKELEGKFDVVFNHTTLEHVFNVFKAFENLCRLSSDIVIVVVPFAQVQHECPNGYNDYWRFTPTCLKELFNQNGLEVTYEAANNDFNAATYILMVGSKKADSWANQMPEFEKLQEVADWIGSKDKVNFLTKLFQR